MANGESSNNGEWTVGRLLQWTREHFTSRGLDEPRLCAELLLAKAMNCRKIELYTRINEFPSPDQRSAFRDMVKAAGESKPIAYLIGHREFYSLDFVVTPDVLIPRPETELIVEHALAWCKANPQDQYHLLDVGTGSGCIAITIAKRNSAVHTVAGDISLAALSVATTNAERHGVASRVRFVEADFLDLPQDARSADGFDMVVSNPPYIAESERESLPDNVRNYEPHIALFSGEDGLTSYRRIAAGIGVFLRVGGTMLLEIGMGQAEAVTAIFAGVPGLALTAIHKDLAGIQRTLQFTRKA